MADNDYVFKAFIVNAAEYDNGNKETSGAWIYFPAAPNEIKNTFAEIGLPPDADSGKYFFDDYVCNIKSITPLLPLHADVAELSETAHKLSKLEPHEILKLNALMETGAKFETFEQLNEFIGNVDYFTLIPNIYTESELGTYLIYESGIFDLPQMYRDAVEPELFGRYISQMEQGVFTAKGYISKSGDEWQPHELKDYVPKPLRRGFPETEIDTIKQLADDLDTLYCAYSPEYAALADNRIRAKNAIANLLRENKTDEVRAQLYNIAREYHIDNTAVIPFHNRIARFEDCRGIKPQMPSSIRQQLKQAKDKPTPQKSKGREDCL